MTANVTPQFAIESSCLQEVKSATINQTFAEMTNTLALLRRQEAAEETHQLVSCELLASHPLCVPLHGLQAQRPDSAVFFQFKDGEWMSEPGHVIRKLKS